MRQRICICTRGILRLPKRFSWTMSDINLRDIRPHYNDRHIGLSDKGNIPCKIVHLREPTRAILSVR